MKIECLLKREGGTKVTFGRNALKQVVLHFKPVIDGDITSPHVAEVADDLMCPLQNKRVVDILLDNKPRAYAPFDGEQAVIPDDESPEEEDEIDSYDDSVLATLDADTVSNKWLDRFCRDVLGLDPKAKGKIAEVYKQNTGIQLKLTKSATELIRECARVHIADAKDALAIAENNSKAG